MPHRNLMVLLAAAVVSLVCHQRVETNRYGRVLADAMIQIEDRYIEPVAPEELFNGAMDGMVGVLDDPHSQFVNADDLARFNESLNQEFGGVGMEVAQDPETKHLQVVAPLFGTPAYEAGIRSGDRIVKIEGRKTEDMSLQDAVLLMRGKPGTTVTLAILHPGQSDPVDLKLERQQIPIDTILGDTRSPDGAWNFTLADHPDIGYVRINVFSGKTVSDLRNVLQTLLDNGMEKLILDLRNDPGGLLDAAIAISDLFIDEGVIVSVRRRGQRESFEASPGDTLPDFPMVVLVNQNSASASEILAACLKDHKRAAIAGQRTYGKGTVQQVLDLEGGLGALKLTTADYWRPNGRNINRGPDSTDEDDWGVRPSPKLKVVLDDEEYEKLLVWRLRRDIPEGNHTVAVEGEPPDADFVDRQLARAIEYLTGNLDVDHPETDESEERASEAGESEAGASEANGLDERGADLAPVKP